MWTKAHADEQVWAQCKATRQHLQQVTDGLFANDIDAGLSAVAASADAITFQKFMQREDKNKQLEALFQRSSSIDCTQYTNCKYWCHPQVENFNGNDILSPHAITCTTSIADAKILILCHEQSTELAMGCSFKRLFSH